MKWILGIVSVLIIVAAVALFVVPAKAPPLTDTTPTATTTAKAEFADQLTLDTPLPGESISSPLTISGQARGTWFFEASAPFELKDATGKVIAQGTLRADNWMTEDFTPFSATIAFPAQPAGSKGTLILKNDNPSGDPARDKVLEVPVTFK
ncbi:MAG: Gmad2 immunoglobulin-like domain-containing protein [Patescibacteria group bacterium]